MLSISNSSTNILKSIQPAKFVITQTPLTFITAVDGAYIYASSNGLLRSVEAVTLELKPIELGLERQAGFWIESETYD